MNPKLRKTLIASAIAALLTSPAWAASDPTEQPAETPQTEPGPGATHPMGKDRGVGPGDTPRGVGPGDTPPMGQGRGVGPGGTPPMGQGRDVAPDDTPPADADPDDAITDNPLYALTPEDLRDAAVLDVEGEEIGKLKSVVLDPETDEVHAVIAVGGFLGLGASEIIVEIDELQLMEDDKLQASATKKELEAREEYVPEQFVELEPDRPIGDLAAIEPDETEPDETEPDETEPDETEPDETDETDPEAEDQDETDPEADMPEEPRASQ